MRFPARENLADATDGGKVEGDSEQQNEQWLGKCTAGITKFSCEARKSRLHFLKTVENCLSRAVCFLNGCSCSVAPEPREQCVALLIW